MATPRPTRVVSTTAAGIGEVLKSASCGSKSQGSGSSLITEWTGTIKTTGKPIVLMVVPSTNDGFLGIADAANNWCDSSITLDASLGDGVNSEGIRITAKIQQTFNGTAKQAMRIPMNCQRLLTTLPAGTYTLSGQIANVQNTGAGTVTLFDYCVVAYELL